MGLYKPNKGLRKPDTEILCKIGYKSLIEMGSSSKSSISVFAKTILRKELLPWNSIQDFHLMRAWC